MRWGGQRLSVRDWVANLSALTCLALSAHNMHVTRALRDLRGLAHLELSTVSGALPGCRGRGHQRAQARPAPGVRV